MLRLDSPFSLLSVFCRVCDLKSPLLSALVVSQFISFEIYRNIFVCNNTLEFTLVRNPFLDLCIVCTGVQTAWALGQRLVLTV